MGAVLAVWLEAGSCDDSQMIWGTTRERGFNVKYHEILIAVACNSLDWEARRCKWKDAGSGRAVTFRYLLSYVVGTSKFQAAIETGPTGSHDTRQGYLYDQNGYCSSQASLHHPRYPVSRHLLQCPHSRQCWCGPTSPTNCPRGDANGLMF